MHYHWLPCSVNPSDFDVSKTCRDQWSWHYLQGLCARNRSYTAVNHSAFKTYPKIWNSDFFIQIVISKTSNRKKNNYFFLFEILGKLPYVVLKVSSLKADIHLLKKGQYQTCWKYCKILQNVNYYPLAQQSCGGDIGSVPYVCMWVRTYVRSFVCSPALATSFIIQFRYNFTQVLDMTIPRTSSRFSVIGSRSRSQWLFLEKLCHHSSAFIYKPILILFHTNV